MAETAADVIVQVLLDWGVETVFGVPGDGAAGLVEALRRRRDRIRFVLARDAFAAGVARIPRVGGAISDHVTAKHHHEAAHDPYESAFYQRFR